jgi:hypothetical protein
MARVLLLLMALMPLSASASDETRLLYLEQEVLSLRRQVQELTRQVSQYRAPTSRAPTRSAPLAASTAWIDAAKWRALKNGMSEFEVISALGPPTSMRQENGDRVLYYAMEIGSSGFLSGSVVLRERAVAEVRAPALQ